MTALIWYAVAIHALAAVGNVINIGKPRKSITKEVAAMSVVINGMVIVWALSLR